MPDDVVFSPEHHREYKMVISNDVLFYPERQKQHNSLLSDDVLLLPERPRGHNLLLCLFGYRATQIRSFVTMR